MTDNFHDAIDLYVDDIDWTQCPQTVVGTLRNYLQYHIGTGGFLEAVLSNDLVGSLGRADERNKECLHDIVRFLYNEAPAISWGSKNRYREWLKRRLNA